MSLVLYHDIYRCQGDQPQGCLVLIHGWGINSLVWDDLIPLLNNSYDICIVDLPGFGRSPLPKGEYTLDFLLEKVLEVVPDQAIWVGWSLGGLLSQYALTKYPERISKIFAIATNPKFVAEESWPCAMPEKVFSQFQVLLEEDWQGTLIRFLSLQCVGSDTKKTDTKKLREYVFQYGLPAMKALRGGLEILEKEDMRAALEHSESAKKTVYILGEYDALVPAACAQQLSHLLDEHHVHVVEGAGHIPHMSHPEIVRDIILHNRAL